MCRPSQIFPYVFLISLFFGLPAANAGAEETAREEARSNAERQARAELESLLARLCPGRCELIALEVTVDEPQALGSVNPGFEGAANTRFDVDVQRVEATILIDSNLPQNFQSNLPRLAQFRLQDIASTIEVRPELLAFPDPQLPPMPEAIAEPPPPMPAAPEPTPPPAPTSEPDERDDVTKADATPAAPGPDTPPLWQALLPWIAMLVALLILAGLIIVILRRLDALTAHLGPRDQRPAPETTPQRPVATMPDTDALEADLTRSRAALNRMLRSWIDDDPQEVAALVRLVGPSILADLRSDPQARGQLTTVSEHVASLEEAIDAPTAQSIAEKARSRFDAQLVVEDATDGAQWEFLEGLTLGQISTLLDDASRREQSFLLSRLSPVLRSRYMEQLSPDERRQLLLDTSASQSLTRSESRKLAGRLRQRAEEFTDTGHQTAGQAAMIAEMIEAMALPEQEQLLRDLADDRPDVAQQILSRICLETALVELPDETLSDAIHRIPVDTLATFLQGTRDQIAHHVLDAAPAQKRQAVATELSLEIPTTRANFLEARTLVSDTLVSTLRKNGYDIVKFNTEALRTSVRQASSQPQSEVAP